MMRNSIERNRRQTCNQIINKTWIWSFSHCYLRKSEKYPEKYRTERDK